MPPRRSGHGPSRRSNIAGKRSVPLSGNQPQGNSIKRARTDGEAEEQQDRNNEQPGDGNVDALSDADSLEDRGSLGEDAGLGQGDATEV